LEEAIREFEGTVIVVSHDRYFLNRIADLLIVLEPGRCEVVFGNYDTYELLRANRETAEKKGRKGETERLPSDNEAAADGATRRSNKTPKRKRKFPYRKVEELEKDIAAGEAKVTELEASLASAETYRDAAKFHDTMKAFDEEKTKLAQLYQHWEEAVELN